MDGRVYNYNAGPWNACNENFQAASLELQNSVPHSREGHMVRDPSKAMASASSYMFLNYPEDHIHPSNQHVMHRAQWQLPQWPKMKPHPGHGHKSIGIGKEEWSGMPTTMHAGPSLFNIPSIPPPGPFCSSDMSDRLIDNIHDSSASQQNTGMAYISDRPVIRDAPHQVQSTPKPVAKKNPQPRKKREKKKTDTEKKKRTRNEESWARNKRKKARARGESYMSVVGKMMRAKEVQPVDCSKCKFHCPDHVSDDDRLKLFTNYWSLESFKDKVNFLSDCVEEFVPLRPISGKRLYSRRYKLRVGEDDDEKVARVCKEFFISTFDISESTIVTFMNKKRKNPDEIKDCRGHQIPSNKTPPEVVQSIREHILSQTGLQGCLTKSQLEEVKNMKRLHTHYQSECEFEEKKPASMSVYRKVYGDMHKGKTEAPVLLPPDDILESISPPKRSKTIKPEPLPPVSANDDSEPGADEDDADEPLSAEPLNLSPPNLPNMSQQQQQVVSSSANVVGHPGNSPIDIMASHHHIPTSRQMSEEKVYGLNIPMSHPQHLLDNTGPMPTADNSLTSPSFDTGAHLNQLMPLMWGTHRMTQPPNSQPDMTGIRGVQSYSGLSAFPNTNHNPMHHMTQSCLFSNPNTATGSPVFPNQTPVMHTAPPTMPDPSLTATVRTHAETVGVKKPKKPKSSVKIKPKKEVKKRTRNEECWGRNIRKRLRFKGEEYVSVKGKMVGAKTIQDVDCSKCKYKCSTKITQEQRVDMNTRYWKIENYEKRIEFISKYVQTYVPKRKMTGRRAYSRNYTFIVDDKHVRVCKNFFITTLHISESIVATCLKKARKGPSAVKDMRGKHKPVNKTPEDVLQSIRELIIYLTGVRPKRKGNTTSKVAEQYQDINRLYLIYKYDSEKKGKKVASHGIFRNVLLNEFGFTGNSKFKKSLISKISSSKSKASASNSGSKAQQAGQSSSRQEEGKNPNNGESTDSAGNPKQPELVEVSEGSSTHPVFSTCLLSSF